MNQIDEKELGAFFAAEMVALAGELPSTGALHHYTRPQRALEILRSGEMKAYCIESMNDAAEILYSVSIARAHIDRACAVEQIDTVVPLFEAMQRAMNDRFANSNVFVLSFSDNGDELGMWGLYADRRRGVCLTVSLADAARWANANNGYLIRVRYEASDIDGFCARAIAKIRNMFLKALAGNTRTDAQHYAEVFLLHAIWFAPAYKAKVWSDEHEWRLVFIREPDHHVADGPRHYVRIPAVGTGRRVAPAPGTATDRDRIGRTPCATFVRRHPSRSPLVMKSEIRQEPGSLWRVSMSLSRFAEPPPIREGVGHA